MGEVGKSSERRIFITEIEHGYIFIVYCMVVKSNCEQLFALQVA